MSQKNFTSGLVVLWSTKLAWQEQLERQNLLDSGLGGREKIGVSHEVMDKTDGMRYRPPIVLVVRKQWVAEEELSTRRVISGLAWHMDLEQPTPELNRHILRYLRCTHIH